MHLQAKLTLALLPLVSVPVLALGWLAWDNSGEELRRGALLALDMGAMESEQLISDQLAVARANLDLLAASPEVKRYAWTEDTRERHTLRQPSLLKRFHDYRRAYPAYEHLCYLLPDGSVDARAAPPGDRREHAAAFDPADLPATGVSFNARADAADDTLLLFRRLTLSPSDSERAGEGARLLGYLALKISLEPIYRGMDALRLPESAHVLLATDDGTLLHRSGHGAAGEQQSPALHAVLTDAGDPHVPDLVTLDGRRLLVRVEPVEGGLLAIALMPLSALFEPMLVLALKILGLTLLLGLLLAAALRGWLRKLVLVPLDELRHAARAIGEGELNPEIRVRSGDEIGLLAEDLRDMGERLGQYREQIEELAFHDQLTNLPNRRLIRELLADRLADAEATGELVAVLFLDIDNFKQINDNLGHAVGDRLLATFAARLSGELDPEGLGLVTHLARFGGDELLVVAESLRGADDAGNLASRILAATAEPFDLGEGQYVVTASIGVALYPRDAEDADGLIRCADLAMYRAKAVGRNAYRFFSADLNAKASERLLIEHRLRNALTAGHLCVHYQPIVALETGALVAFEALLRWTDPELGPISPARFVPIAEETGLIEDLGRWVLSAVCAQLADWRSAGRAPVPVAVNISPAHLQREGLAELLADLLRRHGLQAADLQLEITESVLIDLTATNTRRLQALTDLGIAIHIDDFGTGYSSINYLRRLEIDCIKIDRSFVANICERDEDRALVSAMIAMAQALSLSIVAEGIETAGQLELLRGLGCDLGQGYLFARAGDVADAERFMADAHARRMPGRGPDERRRASVVPIDS